MPTTIPLNRTKPCSCVVCGARAARSALDTEDGRWYPVCRSCALRIDRENTPIIMSHSLSELDRDVGGRIAPAPTLEDLDLDGVDR